MKKRNTNSTCELRSKNNEPQTKIVFNNKII